LPLTRSQKEAVVAATAERLKKAEALIVTDYRGLDVGEMTRLRRQLADGDSEFKVVKNRLVKLALKQAGLEDLDDFLEGPTALAFLYDDLSGPTKAIKEVAKETELLVVKGGLMQGRKLDAAAVLALAALPTTAELRSSLLALLQAPQRNFVGVLGAPLRDFVGVLNARAANPITQSEG